MSTSGSINYNRTRDQIIDITLKVLGVLGEGETASSNAVSDMSILLNLMIKGWQAQGINLWREDEAVVFFADGTNTYTLSSSDDHASTEIIKTELSTAGVTNDTTIYVDSVSGMAASDKIGVELDDGTLDWTTIVSTDTNLNTVLLTSGLNSAAAINNNVYVYTTKLTRPLDITSARLLYDSGIERELHKVGRNEYMARTNKTMEGDPLEYYYSPQLNNGKLYLWPTPANVKDRLRITYIRTIEDFDSSSDDPDLPQEWLDAIVYNLAVRAAPMYGVRLQEQKPEIILLAQQTMFALEAYDSESSSIYIIPNGDC